MTRTRKWTLGTVLLVVLLLVAGWFAVIAPKRSEAAELNTQAEAQQAANDVLRGKIAVLKSQSENLPEMEAKLAEIRQKLPANPALPGLVRSLSSIAAKSGVTLTGIEPQTPSQLAAAKTVTAPAQPGAAPADPAATPQDPASVTVTAQETGVVVVPMTISVTGSYFDIEQFFNKLEGLTRSMLVSGFTIKVDDSEAQAAASDQLGAEIKARAYYAPVQTAAAATAPTSTATSPNN